MSDQKFLQQMDEEQKFEKAKWAGLCIFGLTSTLLWLLWIIWNQWGFLMHFFTILAFIYLSYQSISQNAFPLAYKTLKKYYRFTRIHGFFDRTKEKLKTDQVHEFNIQRQDEPERPDSNFRMKAQPQKSSDRPVRNLKLHISKSKPVKQVHKKRQRSVSSFRKEQDDKKYLQMRQEAKKIARIFTDNNKTKSQVFEHLPMLAKNDYSSKIEQLLTINKQNQHAISNVLEQHYEVKIMFGQQKIPQKLEPVHFDEAIQRLRLLRFTKSLPWSQRSIQEYSRQKIYENLSELLKMRERIDAILKPEAKLTQKQREKIATNLKEQLKEDSPYDRTLLTVVMNLFNENIKSDSYKLQFQRINPITDGLIIVETYIGQRYHVNLKLVQENKSKELAIRPGDDNIWAMLAVAAEIYKLKMKIQAFN